VNTTLENNIKVLIICAAFFFFFAPRGEAVLMMCYLAKDCLRAGESSGGLVTVGSHVLPVGDGWCVAGENKSSHFVDVPQVLLFPYFGLWMGTVEQPELPNILYAHKEKIKVFI